MTNKKIVYLHLDFCLESERTFTFSLNCLRGEKFKS